MEHGSTAIQGSVSEESIGSDIFGSTYNLEWLFDPDRVDHLPIEEQLKYYKHRNLRKTKLFKIASNIWGGPLSRKRVCVAAPMYPMEREEVNSYKSQQPSVTSELKPMQYTPAVPSKEDIQAQLDKDKLTKYKNWIEDRKTFRNNMDKIGLNEEYLSKKPNKTALEHRVLRRMLEEKYPRQKTPPPREETPLTAIIPEDLPVVQRPSPQAICIIEKFLQENKMRLIDLFSSVDKDKNWKLSRDEFRQAVKKAEIPISEVLLEDLILTLDTDFSNQLDYRELAKGMGLWKIEKRETKRKLLSSSSFSSSPTKFSQMSGFESPEKLERLDTRGSSKISLKKSRPSPVDSQLPLSQMQPSISKETSEVKLQDSEYLEKEPTSLSLQRKFDEGSDILLSKERGSSSNGRIKSALSTVSSSSSQNLEPPDLDLRPEIRVFNSAEAMVDLRKRDREALARLQGNIRKKDQSHNKKGVSLDPLITDTKTMVKTGEKAIDDHMLPSTLGDSTAEQVDRFRHLRFMEYNQICTLCKERNIPLSEGLLQKVLMYPPDKQHKDLKKHIRQPANPLLPADFAIPKVDKNRYATPSPDQEESKKQVTKVKVSKEGKVQVLVDSRSAYPPRSKVSAIPVKMNLSSGKAVIRRQVDCWLTYEEYEKLTKNFTTRYVDLHGRVDENAFWPGHLLNKVELCMLNPTPFVSSVFTSTAQKRPVNYGYDNNIRTFPISDAGYVQYGTISK